MHLSRRWLVASVDSPLLRGALELPLDHRDR